MRRLMWFSVGFLAACAVCAYFLVEPWLLAGAAAFAVGACVCLAVKWRPVAAVCLGICAGLGWYWVYDAGYLSPLGTLPEEPVQITAQCTDYGYVTGSGTAVDAVVYIGELPYGIRLYLRGALEIEPGDVVMGEFTLEPSLHTGGRLLEGYQASDAQLGKSGQIPFWCMPARWRHGILGIIGTHFPDDAAPFAAALLLGDRSGFDYETDTAFCVTGISHIVAVSGLHVSILFALVYGLGLHNRWLTTLLGIPALILFAAVAGFSPSITRACIMQLLMLLAMCFEQEYDPPTALAFAVLCMLAADPMTVTSVSFQLSVGCMAGIFLFREPLQAWLERGLPKKPAAAVAMTLSATSLTTPLAAVHFGCVSLLSVLTNLLTLWAVSFIFYGIMAVCLLSAFYTVGADLLGWVIAWPIRYVLGLSKLLAKFPLAAVYTESVYITIWLVGVYALLAVFLLSRVRRPGVLAGCGFFGLVLALVLSWAEPAGDACRMTVLDVGQGQSILLQSGGRSWLVDCGGSSDREAADTAARRLLSQGVFRLDGVIVTHYDRDHAGGVPYLLTRVPAELVIVPDVPDESGMRRTLTGLAERSIAVDRDLRIDYAGTSITVFGPARTNSDNESSLGILFQAANCDILITSDRSGFGEALLLRKNRLPRLEILVAGHHGAATSTSEELLAAAMPAVVAISVGANAYGHPAPALLERLAEYGCVVYRTDRDGTITFRR